MDSLSHLYDDAVSTPRRERRRSGRRRRSSTLVASAERVRRRTSLLNQQPTPAGLHAKAARDEVCNAADLALLDELVPLGRRVFDVLDPGGHGVVSSSHALNLYARLGEYDSTVSITAWREIVHEVESVHGGVGRGVSPGPSSTTGEVTRARWMAWIRHLRDTTHAPFQIHDMHDELSSIVRNLRRASLVTSQHGAGGRRNVEAVDALLLKIDRECAPLVQQLEQASSGSAVPKRVQIIEAVTGANVAAADAATTQESASMRERIASYPISTVLMKHIDGLRNEHEVDEVIRSMRKVLKRLEMDSVHVDRDEFEGPTTSHYVIHGWLTSRSRGVRRKLHRRQYMLRADGQLFCNHLNAPPDEGTTPRKHFSRSDVSSVSIALDDDEAFIVTRTQWGVRADDDISIRERYVCDGTSQLVMWLEAMHRVGWTLDAATTSAVAAARSSSARRSSTAHHAVTTSSRSAHTPFVLEWRRTRRSRRGKGRPHDTHGWDDPCCGEQHHQSSCAVS